MSVIGPRPGLWNQDILTAERDKYNATASAEGYSIDGIALKLSDKDQKWLGIRDLRDNICWK